MSEHLIRLQNVRLSFPSLRKPEPVMIDKTKPFYLIRTPHAFTGLPRPNPNSFAETPELYRAVQSLDEARSRAMAAVTNGEKPSLDVYEVRLVGRIGPPAPQWQPIKQPRKAARHKHARGGKRGR